MFGDGAGKLVAAIGIENGYVIGQDLALLATYHELGARYITLAHNGHNDIADSAQHRAQLGDEEVEHNGISEFGAQVIAEMNRLGIMVDVSHISKEAALDAMRLSRAPVIASHSSVHALAAQSIKECAPDPTFFPRPAIKFQRLAAVNICHYNSRVSGRSA